jgi:hypothetical protein
MTIGRQLSVFNMTAPMLELHHRLKWQRAKHNQGFDGSAPVTEVSVNLKIYVQHFPASAATGRCIVRRHSPEWPKDELTRNSRVEEDLVDQLFNSSEKRLARVLLLMANFGKESKPEPVKAKISQEMIGISRSRVSLFMSKFRKLGFIK